MLIFCGEKSVARFFGCILSTSWVEISFSGGSQQSWKSTEINHWSLATRSLPTKNRCFFKQKTRKQHIFNTSSKCYCCVSLNFPCLRWVIPTDFRSNFFWHRGMDWMGRWWKTLLFIWWCAYQDLLAVETSSQKKTSTIHPPQCKVNTWCWRNIELCHFLSKHLFLLNHSLQKFTVILMLN